MPYPHYLHPDDGSVRSCIEARRYRRQGFQLVEIILLKDEIYHDIDAETHKIQEARNQAAANSSKGEAVPVTTIATDDRSRYLMDRIIDKYVSVAVRRLSAYLVLPSAFAHRIVNNHTKSWQEKSILISLPQRWPPHLLEPLRDAVHTLIVKGTEKEWLSTALSPNDAYVMLCQQEADDADADITSDVNARYGPTSSTFAL